jgi:hypothetical protein
MPSDEDPTVVAALTAAQAAAARGVSQAQLAYQLSERILKDGQFEVMPALVTLVGTVITEGLAAYAAEPAAYAGAVASAGAQYAAFVEALKDVGVAAKTPRPHGGG